MIVLEFLETTRYVYYQLNLYNINSADIKYIEMVKEYNKMVEEGRNEQNVRSLMHRKYNISASTVSAAIKRLNREIEFE